MAEGKKSFILYTDQIHLFEGLEDSEAGILIKHIFKYVNDMNPECDKLTKIAFEPIKQQLKRDLIVWNEKSVNRSASGYLGGVKSGETRRKQKEANEANEASALKSKQKEANEAVNDNDNVNVNVNVNNKKIHTFSFKDSLIDFGFDEKIVADWILVRKNKKATNSETAFKTFITEIEKKPCDLNETLKIIVSKSWSGFKWDWLKEENSKTQIKPVIERIPNPEVKVMGPEYFKILK